MARDRSKQPVSSPRYRVTGALGLALVAGVVTWLVLRPDGGSSSPASTVPKSGAVAVSQQGLRTLASKLGHPVFWLGPERGHTYELTRTANGRIFVRYLPAGVPVASDKPFLTVATYPFPDAFAAIRMKAEVNGAVTVKLADGGIALLDGPHPQSVHVAYPGLDYEIEVYDPTPARALELVSAGRLTSFGRLKSEKPTTAPPALIVGRPAAATAAGLQAVAREIGHPIYWAGRRAGDTYELTETANGNVYVRYLPPGVKVGDPRADFLIVATYPIREAFAAVRRTAGAVAPIRLSHRGIAVVDQSYPKSIHLAFPGVPYKVEVFDPSPATTLKVVASGRVGPVGG
jgi:hypothetical protein